MYISSLANQAPASQGTISGALWPWASWLLRQKSPRYWARPSARMRKWKGSKGLHLGEWNCLRESERHCSSFLVGRKMSFTQVCKSYKLRLVGCFTSCLPSLARVCFWCQASHVDRNFHKTNSCKRWRLNSPTRCIDIFRSWTDCKLSY